MTKIPSGYRIDTEKNQSLKITLPKEHAERNAGTRIVFLQFRVKNLHPSKDVAVWLEEERNKLTAESHFYYNGNAMFTYAIMLGNDQEETEIHFGKGCYEITDMNCVLQNVQNVESERVSQSEFVPDKIRTQGNVIAGKVDVKQGGYFITTIPYETNFEILVDGKAVEYEKVNTAFLGFPVEKGKSDIEIIYHAPGLKLGKAGSVSGVLLFALYLYKQRRKRRKGGIFSRSRCILKEKWKEGIALNEDTKKLLDECSSGCKMATGSMNQVEEYVEDEKLKKVIDSYKQKHAKLDDEIAKMLQKEGKCEKEPGMMAATFSWFTTEMKLMMKSDNRQIAKLMMDGCNMGIQSISERQNECAEASAEALGAAKDLIKIEEDFMQKMKQFL